MQSPAETYASRLERHRADAARLTRQERAASMARLMMFAAMVAVAIFRFSWWILLPLAAFVALIVLHDRLITARRRCEAAARFCERGIARVDGSWVSAPHPAFGHPLPDERGEGSEDDDPRFAAPGPRLPVAAEQHPFAGDLDLFGRGSLFELMSIAATAAGRGTLARWLLHPERVTAAEVRERQEAVAELRGDVAFREELAIAAADVAREVEEARLEEWSRAPSTLRRGERIAAIAITALTVAALALGVPAFVSRFVNATNPGAMAPRSAVLTLPLLVMIVVAGLFARRVAARVAQVVGAVERREPALALLASLLAVIERRTFTSPRLAALRASLERGGLPASRQIERLRKLVALLDARRNQFFAPFALLLLWSTHVAFAIERWRADAGAEIVGWIEAVGELEALLSLASCAFEHPSFVMPEVIDGDATFDGEAIGHPLIPDDRRVANDVRLGGELRLLIVSGSNMSGKSTLLRAIGVNTLLALAGAPVCARRLRVTPMAVGASIRLHDSLQEGASRFYAEILRLRQIIALCHSERSEESPAGSRNLLFLLDEVLAGTNSHDRRIGAEAIVRGLVERGAIGLATTHDLALARIADDLAPRAANVHFEDQLSEGRVTFDYRMRPGVVTKSNALELMRAVGIEV